MPRETKIDWTRVKSDVNGNPRYVLHWIAIGDNYQQALEIGRKYGGRKYHNKMYGGGIVFKSYDLDGLEKALLTHKQRTHKEGIYSMGYFSWKTADTNKSISNIDSSRGARPVYLITPDGVAIYEDEYEGYGEFGGLDAFALLAKWNAPDLCKGDPNYDRSIGIDLFYGKDPVKYPLKFVDDLNNDYEDLPASETCPLQGFFYDDED